MTINDHDNGNIAKYYGISKILPHITTFLLRRWKDKVDILSSIAVGLEILHTESIVHCNLHSGNILDGADSAIIDLDLLNNNDMRQHKIADENQKNTSKSQKQELFELLSDSNKLRHNHAILDDVFILFMDCMIYWK
ncbi:8991_t:CDS:2 [Diversispora eburnea]|uniref:8991_t:CDS:1 n=1 Tax=Diversispora eburnea TaxID=1213867 RepID=A0A9N9BVE3_9GLOM|nr:8991_t:CDS:2 [Diversispora eburnea]